MSFAVYVLDWVGALKGKGVWVRMYWYEAEDAYRDVVDGAGLPIAGRLVDAARMMRAYDAAEDLGPRTVSAHAHLEALMGDGAEDDPDEAICSRMGMDAATWRAVDAAQAAMGASRPRTCDDWDD